jgi:lincosamide nucleotidyltransferase B/F
VIAHVDSIAAALLRRLDDIGASIASTNNALALIGLGSVGVELDRLDDYSDLDFFVVAKDGRTAEFIANLDWLSRARPLIFAFKNTPDGYKVLFDDDTYAEFAVFELHELEAATYTEGRIVWKDDAFDEQWRIPKKQPVPWKPESREWLIGEIVTCLYVGLCRYRRGEQLSAWRFVQGHAFTLLLELIEFDRSDPSLDVFSKERRFEQRHPEWPAHLSRFLAGYDRVVESAQKMLTYLDENYTVQPDIKRVILNLCRAHEEQSA